MLVSPGLETILKTEFSNLDYVGPAIWAVQLCGLSLNPQRRRRSGTFNLGSAEVQEITDYLLTLPALK